MVREFEERLAGYGIDMSQYTTDVVLDQVDEIEIHFNHKTSDRQIRCYCEIHVFKAEGDNNCESRRYSMVFAIQDPTAGS